MRSKLNLAALGAGVLAVVMLLAVLVVRPMEAAAGVYTAAFFVGLGGVALAAADSLHERHQRLAFLPQTRLGWWSLAVAVVSLVLFVVGAFVLTSNRPEGPGVPMFLVRVPAFGGLIAAGIIAVVAWFRRQERSLLVLLTVLPSLFAVYFVMGEFVFPH
ncbi:hypothetical protein [Propioniciclava sinopodophylli]|uniref:hypothetical protein n=1 Tax=Propioniciclava sinopodophylli TaxID=1837344 RepID=UPI002493B4D9|nr:hypothetical protein [Propioniciclava sinopodophylli]